MYNKSIICYFYFENLEIFFSPPLMKLYPNNTLKSALLALKMLRLSKNKRIKIFVSFLYLKN